MPVIQDGLEIHSQCKICRSKHCAAVNDMLIEGAIDAEIVATFPDINLNGHNVKAHRNHFKFVNKGVETYKQQQEKGISVIVSEIQALDKTYEKAYNYLMAVDFNTEPPRKLEVVSEMMLRAIQTKAELCKDTTSPGAQIQELFANVLKNAKKVAKDIKLAEIPEPPVVEAQFDLK